LDFGLADRDKKKLSMEIQGGKIDKNSAMRSVDDAKVP